MAALNGIVEQLRNQAVIAFMKHAEILVGRFCNIAILRPDAAPMIGCVAIAAAGGVGVGIFWTALVLLGIGWNFLYERAKTQATNDQLVFLATATSSVLSGWLLQRVGWPGMAVWALPLPAAVLAGTAWLARRNNPAIVGS